MRRKDHRKDDQSRRYLDVGLIKDAGVLANKFGHTHLWNMIIHPDRTIGRELGCAPYGYRHFTLECQEFLSS